MHNINIEVNGTNNSHKVGFLDSNFRIDYEDADYYNRFDNTYLRNENVVTVSKTELDKLGITPQEFVELINNPNSNVRVNTGYNVYAIKSQLLDQCVGVIVDNNGTICASAENQKLLASIEQNIQDQVAYDSRFNYNKEESNENIALFRTQESIRLSGTPTTPPIDISTYLDTTKPYVAIGMNSEVYEVYDEPYYHRSIDVRFSNETRFEHQDKMIAYVQDTFGADRTELTTENEIFISSSTNINASIALIREMKEKLEDIERTGEYEFNGPIGFVQMNTAGHIWVKTGQYYEEKYTEGLTANEYKCHAAYDLKELVITESQTRAMGYEPKDFADLIGEKEGKNLMIEIQPNNDKFSLDSFDVVKVVSDDFSEVLARKHNANFHYRLDTFERMSESEYEKDIQEQEQEESL